MDKYHNYKALYIVALVACTIVIVGVLLSLIWRDTIDVSIGLRQLGIPRTTRYVEGNLIVHIVDVGQGDMTVVELPDGRVVLIDAGTSDAAPYAIEYVNHNIARTDQFAFDKIIITSALPRSIGGLSQLLYAYPPSADTVIFRPNTRAVQNTNPQYIDPGLYLLNRYNLSSSAYFRDVLQIIHDSPAQIVVNASVAHTIYSIGSIPYIFSIIPFGDSDILGNGFTLSGNSPIMLLEYNDMRIVLTHSASNTVKDAFVQRYSDILVDWTADVLTLSNSGGNSNTRDFLDMITSPLIDTVAIASVSLSYRHNLPSRNTLHILHQLGIDSVLYTSKLSHIAVVAEDGIDIYSATATLLYDRYYLIWWQEVVVLIVVIGIIMIVISYYKYNRQKKKRY